MDVTMLSGNTSVQKLQSMLNTIAAKNSVIPFLTIDGIFGEQTLQAVMIFQREYGLPVSGTVDRTTWDTIYEVFQQLEGSFYQSLSANLYPNKDFVIRPNDSSSYLYPIQAMFNVLATVLDNIHTCDVNGIHQGACVVNTELLQECLGLQVDGVFDHAIWESLVHLYDIFVIRNPNFKDSI